MFPPVKELAPRLQDAIWAIIQGMEKVKRGEIPNFKFRSTSFGHKKLMYDGDKLVQMCFGCVATATIFEITKQYSNYLSEVLPPYVSPKERAESDWIMFEHCIDDFRKGHYTNLINFYYPGHSYLFPIEELIPDEDLYHIVETEEIEDFLLPCKLYYQQVKQYEDAIHSNPVGTTQ